MALIELKDINKSFRDGDARINHVLRGVNLSVECGDFVAIEGASGSGKTTLLNILGTLIEFDSGTYELNGTPITSQSVSLPKLRNKDIGFVFQHHGLMPAYTVRQNILLPTLATSSEASAEQCRKAEELMEFTGITSIANQYPDTISGGEASRVAICRALIMQPLLLLADEPTGQLDRENAFNITRLFQSINEKWHTTILMVTHSDETARAAKRILTLRDGKLW